MSLRVHFEPEADTEYQQAGVWYEGRREALGKEFFDEVRRLPYHVVYLETAEELRILAVAHDRRRPGYWQTRLR